MRPYLAWNKHIARAYKNQLAIHRMAVDIAIILHRIDRQWIECLVERCGEVAQTTTRSTLAVLSEVYDRACKGEPFQLDDIREDMEFG